MTLGETIQFCRKRAQLSQEDLAERVGVSRQAVSRWELDETAPEAGKLLALAGALQITVDQLLRGEPEAPPSVPPIAPPERPSLFRRMARRCGWLAGVYLALGGVGLTAAGTLARQIILRECTVTVGEAFGTVFPDIPPDELSEGLGQIVLGLTKTGEILANIALILALAGGLIFLAGGVWAVVLYQRGQRTPQ